MKKNPQHTYKLLVVLSTLVVLGSILFRFGYSETEDTNTPSQLEQLNIVKIKTDTTLSARSAQNLDYASKDFGVTLILVQETSLRTMWLLKGYSDIR